MRRFILGLVGVTSLASIIPGTGVIETLAPVVNSGSGVLAAAFIAGLYTYRTIREKKENRNASPGSGDPGKPEQDE